MGCDFCIVGGGFGWGFKGTGVDNAGGYGERYTGSSVKASGTVKKTQCIYSSYAVLWPEFSYLNKRKLLYCFLF